MVMMSLVLEIMVEVMRDGDDECGIGDDELEVMRGGGDSESDVGNNGDEYESGWW